MTANPGPPGPSHREHRVFHDSDVVAFNALIPDCAALAAVPQPLIAGMFSKILGVDLPGRGTNYLKQGLEFVSAAKVDEELTATVEVVRVVPEKRLVYLVTTCTGCGGRIVAQGRALVLAPSEWLPANPPAPPHD